MSAVTRAAIAIAYDGPALKGGVMDVRDLAPALLAVGQLVDAANTTLNGDTARVSVQVTATGVGSFDIYLQVAQSLSGQVVSLFASEPFVAAGTIATLVFGTPATKGLIWLIRHCRGKKPTHIERLTESIIRLVIEGEVIEIPMHLLRLYQDIAVRTAAQKLIEEPLQKPGIDTFEVKDNATSVVLVNKDEASYFSRPEIPEETLVDEVRRLPIRLTQTPARGSVCPSWRPWTSTSAAIWLSPIHSLSFSSCVPMTQRAPPILGAPAGLTALSAHIAA